MQRTALTISFQQIKPTAGAPITDFFTRLLDIRNQLAGTSQALDDATIKARIYATLPPEFLTTAIYQQNLPEDTPLESVMDALIRDESMRALSNPPPALKEAHFSIGTASGIPRGRGRGRGGRGGRGRWGRQTFDTKWCTHCQRNTHDTKDCWSRPTDHDDGPGDDNRGNLHPLKCWFCGESGHRQQNCAVREKGREAEREFKRRKFSASAGNPPEKTESANLNLTVGTRSAGPGF